MTPKPWPILTETGLDTDALLTPLRARKPWHYTVGDVFALPPEQCAAAFGVMAATPQHTYLVEAGPGAAGWFEWFKQAAEFHAIACDCSDEEGRLRTLQDFGARAVGVDDSLDATPWLVITACPWPLPNVHLVTPPVSTQAELDARARWVLRCPAAARALRLVPTEGLRIGFALPHAFTPGDANYGWERQCGARAPDNMRCCGYRVEDHPRPDPVFDLVTLRGATAPLHPDVVRSVRDQCAAAGVAFRFEGWGPWFDVTDDEPGSGRLRRSVEDRIILPSGEVIGAGYRVGRKVSGSVSGDWKERGAAWMARIGRESAGRLLDGVTHDGEVPTC